MTKQLFIILVFLVFLSGCFRGASETTYYVNEDGTVETPEERVFRLLKEKADTAYTYCKEHKMNTDFCFLVDMRMHSGKKRFVVWDFKGDSVLTKSLCAHGYGLDSTQEEPVFSNVEGSYCTSLGKYKTGARSYSNWGIHVHYKLHGLEDTNSNAFRRIIVLHSHTPIPDYMIYPAHLRLGMSQGCPVINDKIMMEVDELLKKQTKPSLLWVYY